MADLELLGAVREVPREQWNALVGAGSPFLEWDWLSSLEVAECVGPQTGWIPRPLVVREKDRVIAACPLYIKLNSEGEFVFDHGWAEAAERAGIPYYPKLLAGIPFTPVGGSRLLVAPGENRPRRIRQLAQVLRELCRVDRIPSVHVNFCRVDEVEPLQAAGFDLRFGLQYHWSNRGYAEFEEFLQCLRSRRRNQVRREMRKIRESGIEIEIRSGDAIPQDCFPYLFRCYRSTVRNHPWGREYLNQCFFEQLRDRFRQRLCVVLARRGGRPIAAALNVRKGAVLYGRYWGSTESVPYLHFNVCYYAGVDYCIRHGIERFEPGAGGDYKQVRGFDACPTWSLHFIADARLRGAVSRYLAEERQEVGRVIAALRHESALKPASTDRFL